MTAYAAGRRIVITSVESTFPIEMERAVEPTGLRSCRVSATIRGGPERRSAWLAAPLVGHMEQKPIDGDQNRLVGLLESTESA